MLKTINSESICPSERKFHFFYSVSKSFVYIVLPLFLVSHFSNFIPGLLFYSLFSYIILLAFTLIVNYLVKRQGKVDRLRYKETEKESEMEKLTDLPIIGLLPKFQ